MTELIATEAPDRRAGVEEAENDGAPTEAPDDLIPRADRAVEEVNAAIAFTRQEERRRRLREWALIGGGWLVAVVMGLIAAAALAVLWHRPVPQDRIHVALMHSDGTYDPPVPVENLPRTLRDVVFRHTVINYIEARENYTWEAVRRGYNQVSAMSAPDERDRYQTLMLDKKNPQNPMVLYGEGLGAKTATVVGVLVIPDAATPNAVEAHAVVAIQERGQPNPRVERRIIRATWMPAEDKIPINYRLQWDPLGVAFTHYTSELDPDQKPR